MIIKTGDGKILDVIKEDELDSTSDKIARKALVKATKRVAKLNVSENGNKIDSTTEAELPVAPEKS